MNTIIQSTSGTLRFRLKDTKSAGETSIILDYSFGRGNRLKYATGFKTHPKHWDLKNQRIRAVSTIRNREEINNKLKHFEVAFIKAVSALDESQKQNRSVLKGILDTIVRDKGNVSNEKTGFFGFAEGFIAAREDQIKNVKSVKLSPITLRAYKQTLKKLREFDKKTKYGLDFSTVDMNFYYAFVGFLEEQDYCLNTIGKHIKNLMTILNRATEEGVNNNLKYKHRDFKMVREDTTAIYLTPDEIDTLYNLDLSDKPQWEMARDIFLIGYYTGQRVSDYNGLTKAQIMEFDGREVFEIFQKKTQKTVYVPLHPCIKKMMEDRYHGDLPKKLSDQKINDYIKNVGRKADIKDDVVIKKTIGGTVREQIFPKYKLIGTHTARRSFCTNAYLSKMPTLDIMALSGHTTEREFYKYIRVTPQERAVKIADSAFFQ